MAKRVDFKLTKNWGLHKKGKTFKRFSRAQARYLQDVHKVGKIVEPKDDKVDPNMKSRETK